MTALQELASRLINSRKPRTDNGVLARDLLAGFYDVCMRSGLDRVLVELAQAHAPLDITDRSELVHHQAIVPAVVAQLATIDLDAGGPRNAKPLKLTECLVNGLGLTIVDEPDRTIVLDHAIRAAAMSAMATVIDVELAVPTIRERIVTTGRAACEQRYVSAFDRLAAELDERGMRVIKQPKIPLDAVQAVQRVLTDARVSVLRSIADAGIDRAKPVIEGASTDAAARIDQPITLRMTPRDVVIERVCDPRVPKNPAAVVESIVDGLAELSRVSWRAPEQAVRPYGASQTFSVGDLIEHPKFGRGTVLSTAVQRMEVEFPDGKYTLVHVGRAK